MDSYQDSYGRVNAYVFEYTAICQLSRKRIEQQLHASPRDLLNIQCSGFRRFSNSAIAARTSSIGGIRPKIMPAMAS